MKFNPVPYESLRRGAMFTLHGDRTLYIKHSNAVAFDSEGKDAIFSLYDPCYPKVVEKDVYHRFMRYVLREDARQAKYHE